MPLHEGCLDLISLGAYDSIVPSVDSELFDLAMVRVWLHALDLDLSGGLKRSKITVDQDALRSLRLACKKDLYTLVLSHGSADSLMTSGELFYLCVNRYFHAEGGKAVKEFRMPLGTVVRRIGARGRTKIATIGSGFHPDLFVNSLFLCIAASHGIDAAVSWVPIFVLRKYMAPAMRNMRQRQVKYAATLMALSPGYTFGDVFYAGLLTLYLCGLIRGDIGRIFPGKPAGRRDYSWYSRSHYVAIQLGFWLDGDVDSMGYKFSLSSGVPPSLAFHCWLAECFMAGPDFDGLSDLLSCLPRFVENPTAYLEKMWYMSCYSSCVVHCTYCFYGAKWKKPTSLWTRNFFLTPLCCEPSTPCDLVSGGGKHPENVGGNRHSMQQKWHVPFDLCVLILQSMLCVRPLGTWYLSLFAGSGSMDSPCQHLGLRHVSVSFDRPTDISDVDGCIHVFMDLSRFTLSDVLRKVYCLSGLMPSDFVGYGCHPGCETFSLEDRTRDHSAGGGHLPLTPKGVEADLVTRNCAEQALSI